MTSKRIAIGGRPVAEPDAEGWVRRGDGAGQAVAAVRTDLRTDPRSDPFSARLTIDVTPELRGRIKVTAFRQGLTVADMLRALFEREFRHPGSNP